MSKILVKPNNNNSILEIIISNLSKKNSISLQMWTQIIQIFKNYKFLNKFGCIIIRGENFNPFSSGADINDIKKLDSPLKAKNYFTKFVNSASKAISVCNVPTIASISGECFGAGLIIATSCDLRIASKNAKFAIPAAKIGITLNYEELEKINNLINISFLKELLLTASPVNAKRAYKNGLVNKIVKEENLSVETLKIATAIIENSNVSNLRHLKMLTILNKYGIANIPSQELDAEFLSFSSQLLKKI